MSYQTSKVAANFRHTLGNVPIINGEVSNSYDQSSALQKTYYKVDIVCFVDVSGNEIVVSGAGAGEEGCCPCTLGLQALDGADVRSFLIIR